MNGWYTKHQEFTLAKGDPTLIKSLIQYFKLNGIVSFDETSKLITTTIKHDDYIRLSDLLLLNKKHKVIAFTLRQYLEVIQKLFEFIQKMKTHQIRHGNLRMENILLDLTQSYTKLDNKRTEITFQINLINFAQFYNTEMQDDFEMVTKIYSQIAEQFPIHQNQLNIQNLIQLQDDEQIQQCISQLIDKYKVPANIKKNIKYCWDSNNFPTFQKYYNTNESLPKIFKEIKEIIIQLHQYHLIANHYPELNSKLFKDGLKQGIPYSNEPKNLLKACETLEVLLINSKLLNQVQIKNISLIVGNKVVDMGMKVFQLGYQQLMITYLKKQGYFQNINEFVKIIQNINQVQQFATTQLLNTIVVQSNEESVELPFGILQSFIKSQGILKRIVLIVILNSEIKKNSNIQYSQFKQYELQISNSKNLLMQSLNDIKKIGYKYSKPLIDHSILSFREQIKEKCLSNLDYLNQFMVDSWLNWIDRYIFDKNFNKLSQLNKINKETFIQFFKQEGFQILQQELKKCIGTIVETIFQKLII